MNISDPIPISSVGSSGSITGGVDAARQRSNNTQSNSAGGLTRMDSGLGGMAQSSSLGGFTTGGSSSQYGSAPLGSPNERGAFMDSPSNLNMAGLALDSNSAPGPSTQHAQVVPVGFEEGTLRALCDLDCGFPLLMDRIKQSMASCRVSIEYNSHTPHLPLRNIHFHASRNADSFTLFLITGDKHILQETRSDGGGLRSLTSETYS